MHTMHLWIVLMNPSMFQRVALACLLSTTLACDYFSPLETPDAADDIGGQRDAGFEEDAGSADILVDATGATVSEAGGTVTLSFALSQRPTSLVLVAGLVSDGAEIELDPAELTFTPDQWQQDKTIVVRGLDDLEADGDTLVTVSFDPVVSDDPAYSGLQLMAVDLVNEDGVCGNDVLDGDEQCDPPDLDACLQATGDCTRCNASCQEEVVEGGPSCGDGVVNQITEQCDAPGQPTLCPNGRAVVTCQDGCTLPSEGCEPTVDVSEYGGCQVADDSSITCWGLDHEGVATPPSMFNEVVQVAVASSSACALDDSGKVTCWGAATSLPTNDLESHVLTHIDVSPNHLCGVDDSGAARCIGDDSSGQSSPPGLEFVKVEVSGNGSCGITTDGELTCWGAGAADAPTDDSTQRFAFVSGGGGNWCGLTVAGRISCWGPDVDGELFTQDGFIDMDFGDRAVCGVYVRGAGATGVECVDFDSASWDPSLETASLGELPSLSVGKRSVCFIDDGELACTFSAVHVGHPGVDLVSLEAHEGCVCGVTDAGRLRCGGDSLFCPADELSMLDVVDVALKGDGGCVIEQGTNDIFCWTVSNGSAPSTLDRVNIVGTPVSVEVNGGYGCALDSIGKVTCWNNRAVLPKTPAFDFLAVSIGGGYACGILDGQGAGALDCWDLGVGVLPFTSSTRDLRDVELVGSGGCYRDNTSRLACFGSLTFTYISPNAPGELLSTGKSLCLIESQTKQPACFKSAARISARFEGVRVDLFAHTESTSYAVPDGRALVWRED